MKTLCFRSPYMSLWLPWHPSFGSGRITDNRGRSAHCGCLSAVYREAEPTRRYRHMHVNITIICADIRDTDAAFDYRCVFVVLISFIFMLLALSVSSSVFCVGVCHQTTLWKSVNLRNVNLAGQWRRTADYRWLSGFIRLQAEIQFMCNNNWIKVQTRSAKTDEMFDLNTQFM